jgi:hypothetical protein
METDKKYPTEEQLIEALQECYGIISSACKYLKEKYGMRVHRDWIKSRIVLWGMEEQLVFWRTDGVEDAFHRMFSNAIKDGNSTAIAWILQRYGHYVEFLQPQEDKPLDYDDGAIVRYMEHLNESAKAFKCKTEK